MPYSRVRGWGASGPVGYEHGLSREIREHIASRPVLAAPLTGEDRKVDALDEKALWREMANAVKAQ